MDPFAAPSTAGSHGSPATLSLSTESEAGAGAIPGARIGVAVHGQATSQGSAPLGLPSHGAASQGSAPHGSSGERNDEPSNTVARTHAIAPTQQVLATQVSPLPMGARSPGVAPTHMNR